MDRVAVVVTRWFGGIKLGVGGLIRAYGGTAAECLRLRAAQAIMDMVTGALPARLCRAATVQGTHPGLAARTLDDEDFGADVAVTATLSLARDRGGTANTARRSQPRSRPACTA